MTCPYCNNRGVQGYEGCGYKGCKSPYRHLPYFKEGGEETKQEYLPEDFQTKKSAEISGETTRFTILEVD